MTVLYTTKPTVRDKPHTCPSRDTPAFTACQRLDDAQGCCSCDTVADAPPTTSPNQQPHGCGCIYTSYEQGLRYQKASNWLHQNTYSAGHTHTHTCAAPCTLLKCREGETHSTHNIDTHQHTKTLANALKGGRVGVGQAQQLPPSTDAVCVMLCI